MGRPKKRAERGRTRRRSVRLYPEEDQGLVQLAETLGKTPSNVLRSLVRIGVEVGPDYFTEGVYELRAARNHLSAIGRNLNQLTRLIHRGQFVAGEDVRRAVNACNVQMEAVRQVYMSAVQAAMQRIVLPLYDAAGFRLLLVPKPEEQAPPDVPKATRGG